MQHQSIQGYPFIGAMRQPKPQVLMTYTKNVAAGSLIMLAMTILISVIWMLFFYTFTTCQDDHGFYDTLVQWAETRRPQHPSRGNAPGLPCDPLLSTSLHRVGLHLFLVRFRHSVIGRRSCRVYVIGLSPRAALSNFVIDLTERRPFWPVNYLIQRPDGACVWRQQNVSKRNVSSLESWIGPDISGHILADLDNFLRSRWHYAEHGLPFSRVYSVSGLCDDQLLSQSLARAAGYSLFVCHLNISYELFPSHELYAAMRSLNSKSMLHLKLIVPVSREFGAVHAAVAASLKLLVTTLREIHGCIVLITGDIRSTAVCQAMADCVVDLPPMDSKRLLSILEAAQCTSSIEDRGEIAEMLAKKLRESSLDSEELLHLLLHNQNDVASLLRRFKLAGSHT